MPRRPPEIVSGPRGPEHAPQVDDGAIRPLNVQASPGEVVYQSSIMALRVQLTANRDQIVDGRVIMGESLAAQFEGGVYRTSDPRRIEIIEKSPNFGMGKLFWRASDMAAEIKKAEERQAMDAIAANKQLIGKMLAEGTLKASELEDFVLEAQTA